MSGIKTNLKDLGKSFQKFSGAMLAEEERKRQMIAELRRAFERQGFAPWMATKLAEEKYKQIHGK